MIPFIILFLMSYSSLGAANCLKDFEQFLPQKSHVSFTSDEPIPRHEKNFLIQSAEEIESFFSSFNVRELKLYAPFREGSSFMVARDQTVWVSTKLVKNQVEKNPVHLKTMLAHEYGHLLLRENFYRYFPEVDLRLEKKIYDLSVEILNLTSSEKSEEQIVKDQIAALRLKKASLLQGEYSEVKKILPAYDELFADLVAVVIQKDQNAVTLAINTPDRKSVKVNRGFSHLKVSQTKSDPYSDLNETRLFLESYLKRPSIYKNDLFLHKALVAMISALQDERTRPSASLSELNLRLIEKLRENLN